MRILVVTGPIGSGKGFAARSAAAVAEGAGQRVSSFDLDAIAHQVLARDVGAIQQVRDHFGEQVLELGAVSRSRLADRVFGSREDLAALERITHPAIASELHRLLEEARSMGADWAIVEIPLPVQTSPAADRFREVLTDAVVLSISADPELRHQLTQVRGDEAVDAARRIAVQPEQGLYDLGAHRTVINHGDKDRFLADIETSVREMILSEG